ncbi:MULTISPECIES: hypothetical protein [unclassified Roseateles]|uniref:hypothetical protein n=1 Tax=unclassified Roseateles TaxID=2626991 RepID=UPI0006F880BC|nr:MULTISPECIES: hypothetical protein [unclassified Roseateles]KQW46723.1 hypothetical protein ASC81_10155 [Pelomonas sp. Root405]KRA73775.1 hypothetical protein ASD88_10155 [Pelomonas sp. Root662]
MDMALKDIGITFLVGAFTVLALDWVLLHIAGLNLTGFFSGERLGLEVPDRAGKPVAPLKAYGHKKSFDPTMTAAVFAGLSFGVGILAEDLSYKYMDSVPVPSWRSIHAEQLFGDDELWNFQKDSRLRTLLKRDRARETGWLPKDLAKDLAKANAFSLARIDKAADVEAWLTSPTASAANLDPDARDSCVDAGCIRGETLKGAIANLYYFAKNKVYGDKNYYDEMRRIQARMEFSRSIALVSFFYLIVSIFVGAVVFCCRRNVPLKAIGRRTGTALAALFCIHAAAVWAYEREADEFNKRAFGYFSSMRSR